MLATGTIRYQQSHEFLANPTGFSIILQMMILNIVSLILFFTGVIPLVNLITAKQVTAYTVRKFVKYVQQMLFSLG